MADGKERWEEESYGPFVERTPERDVPYETLSGIPVQPLYTPEDLAGWRYEDKLGYPGEFPYTRGPYPSMYRGRLWTMRMFAGFGRPEDTNARFKYLLEQGQTGLSTAFDMPALMGYDADHPRARGEVGREGVSISTLADFEILFRDIPLDQVTTSMTINCTASVALAMYLALADKQGVGWDKLGGTMQNDMLKEFIAQKEWISPPESAVRVVVDTIEFCAKHVPRFNPVSISGYHIREAGSTAVQELAFTLADGFGYVQAGIERGLDVDDFAPRLSFFFDIHNDFFEEIAKLRAARRIWATVMRDRFRARKPESMRLRTHTQTAGVSATAQQPLNNVARVALQALAAVLGGAQSLHTNSYDEVLALPTEEAVTVALRTQQIIAEETGVALTADPLGGSYFLERLTDQMEAQAMDYIRKIDELGGIVRAIDIGYPQQEIADAAYRYQLMDDRGQKAVVGVNKYVMPDEKPVEYLRIDPAIEQEQIERVGRVKASRDAARVEKRLQAAHGGLPRQPERHAGAGGRREGLRLARRDRRRVSPGVRPLSRADHLLRGANHDRADPDQPVHHPQAQAEGRRPGIRADLHRPHVPGRLPGREGLVRPAGRAVRAALARPGHRGPALRPGHLRRPQGVPRRGRQDPALPAPEARGAHEQLGAAPLHPAARRGHGAFVHRAPRGRRSRLGAEHGGHLALHPAHHHRERGVPRGAAGQVVHLLRHPLPGGRLLSGGHGAGEDPGGGQVRARGGRRRGRGQDLRQLRGEPLRERRGQARGLHPGAVARRRPPEVPRRGRHHEHHGEDRRRDHHAAADRDHPARRDPRFRR